MASLIANCLARLVKEGRVSPKQAKDAQALHDGMQGRLGEDMGAASADAVAALEAARVMGEAAKARKVSIAKQAILDVSNLERMAAHPKGKVAGLNGILARDNFDWHPPGVSGADSVDARAEVIQRKLDAEFAVGHENLKSTAAGLKQDRALAEASLREIFGEDTGNQTAKEIAKGWGRVDAMATARAKAAGKMFTVADDWRIMQRWVPRQVKAVSKGEFTNDLAAELQGGGIRAINDPTTGYPASALKIPAILDDMFTNITAGGGKGGIGAAFSPQMRVIRFADGKNGADAYLRLMNKYGDANDLYGAMAGHIHAAAREIALIEALGPNYRPAFARLLDVAKADEGASKGKYIPILNSAATAEKTFRVLTGQAFTVQSEFWAGLMSGIRGWLRGVQLGGAVVSAVPGDLATMSLAANFNGIDATKIIANVAKTLATDTPANRALAARLGVQAYATADHLSSAGRGFLAWADPKNLGTKFSEVMIRLGGLQVWTNAAKREVSMAFLGEVGSRVGQTFAALDAPFRRFLQRYQIDATAWNALRQTPLLEAPNGARYFDVMSVADPALGEKLMSAIIDERKFFIVEPDVRVQGVLTPTAPKGSFVGETVGSGTMYHSFSMSMANTHLMRSALSTDAGFSKAAYFAKLITATTIAGAMSLVARDVINGKDPRRMNTPLFWAQAGLQGGGAGIFGDFFAAATNRSGGSLAATLGGPVAGLVSDAFDSFAMPIGEFLDPSKSLDEQVRGAEAKWGAGLARFVRNYADPHTFYTQLAMNRLIFDQVQSMIDPEYRASFRRTVQNAQQGYGQGFWWQPGQVTPSRAPNVGTVYQ